MAQGGMSPVFSQEEEIPVSKSAGRSKIFFVVSVSIFLFAFLVAGYVLYQRYVVDKKADIQGEEVVLPKTTTELPKIATTEKEKVLVPLLSDANYTSENFRIGEIAIGGEAEFILTEDSPEPLVISSIRGEAFTEKTKQEVKLVLSWKTNKLAKSEIGYSKGVGQAKKTVNEDSYSLNHSIIIPGLDQASTYVYEIVARDRFGNEATSESHAIFTGSKTVSLFDLIADAIGEVFGWAVKKN
ncbi:MAG: hypothetical protein HYV45_01735 [Candidatus Moranbacteria bacterium]|nr:hypothetical protein [Candidatus Moranbacteria bacterium]